MLGSGTPNHKLQGEPKSLSIPAPRRLPLASGDCLPCHSGTRYVCASSHKIPSELSQQITVQIGQSDPNPNSPACHHHVVAALPRWHIAAAQKLDSPTAEYPRNRLSYVVQPCAATTEAFTCFRSEALKALKFPAMRCIPKRSKTASLL